MIGVGQPPLDLGWGGLHATPGLFWGCRRAFPMGWPPPARLGGGCGFILFYFFSFINVYIYKSNICHHFIGVYVDTNGIPSSVLNHFLFCTEEFVI